MLTYPENDLKSKKVIRSFFQPTNEGDRLVRSTDIEFDWFLGADAAHKIRSIHSLHEAIVQKYSNKGNVKILEVSSYSEEKLGKNLSASNLSFSTKNGKKISVESIFQGSKVFENGGPYTAIYDMTSLEAKKHKELQTSGKLLHFNRGGVIWPLNPETLFYDWIYLNTLNTNEELCEEVLDYNIFTDIAFNPKKSINSQAGSVALFVALSKVGILDDVLMSKESFGEFYKTQRSRRDDVLI